MYTMITTRSKKLQIFQTAVLIFLLTPSLFLSQSKRYQWKFNTVAHHLLQIEENSESGSVPNDFDAKYQLLDNTIDNCLRAVKGQDISAIKDNEHAEKILRMIDSAIFKERFSVCVKVERLSEALTLKRKGSLGCFYTDKDWKINYRSENYTKSDSLYHVDCDLLSFIYLGVGDVLKLSFHVVEVPYHTFIRWALPNGVSVNWDVNTAKITTDDEYRKGIQGITPGFNKETELKLQYLKNLTKNELIGYYYFVVGRSLKKEKKYPEAQTAYLKSIQYRPSNYIARYCLAFMIVFTGAYHSQGDFLLAEKVAGEAYHLYPEDQEVVETYACSLALLGKFSEAKDILKSFLHYDTDLYNAFEKNENGIEVFKKKHTIID